MAKITPTMTVMDVMVTMSEGNPGAAMVLMENFQSNAQIDPISFMAELGTILSLDSLGIYGTDIYVLFNDICLRKMNHFVALIRAHQLGLVDGDLIRDVAHRQDRSGVGMIDVEAVYQQVRTHLPGFDPEGQ